MSFPKVRPPNPDHLALIESLSAAPMSATCPICGGLGFWDNRLNKKNPKSPDYKCKNKDCPGATPLKGKSPYGVWLPAGYADTPPASAKRVPSPYVAPKPLDYAQELKDDPTGAGEAPDAIDYPVAGREPGEEPEPTPAERRRAERQAAAKMYLALWDVVAEHQVAKGKALELPVDGMSVNATCATLWIYFGNKGMLP